jgi:hypothetical protein
VALRRSGGETTLIVERFTGGVSLGALALVVIGAACALARHLMPVVWRAGHWLVLVAFALGFVHSMLIGSETRIEPMTIFYAAGGAAALAVLVWRLTRGVYASARDGRAKSPAR